ncbi:MAG: hypothetical protein R2745_22090 [Vicinamibacterales bacterium]
MRPASERDRHRALAPMAFLTGALSLALLAGSVQPPPASPAALLEDIAAHQAMYGVFASLALAWSASAVVFAAALGTWLEGASRPLASAGQGLVSGGVLLLTFALFMRTGAMLALVSAGPAPDDAAAAHQVRFWSDLSFFLTDPGLFAWGVGQVMLAWLSWRSTLPLWVRLAGLVGGAAGVLTLAVYQTAVLALLQLAAFAAWTVGLGIAWRRPPMPAMGGGPRPA